MASAVAMLLRTVPQLDNGTLVVMIVDLLPINRRLKLIIKITEPFDNRETGPLYSSL